MVDKTDFNLIGLIIFFNYSLLKGFFLMNGHMGKP